MAFRIRPALHRIAEVSGYTAARGISGAPFCQWPGCFAVGNVRQKLFIPDRAVISIHSQTKSNVQPTCFKTES